MANGLTPQQVDTLLDKLGNDDAFRELWSTDTAAALKSLGAPETLAACFGNVKNLASKDKLQSSRATLQKQLLTRMDQAVQGFSS